MSGEQSEFNFGAGGSGRDGHLAWQRQREDSVRAAGRVLGLPLGRRVELELKDGCRMRGVLRLAEDGLFVDAVRERPPLLRMDRCTFFPGDIERCVRVD